jgi:hypothetical protein
MNSFDHNRACFGPDEEYIVAGNGYFYNIYLYVADSSLISWKSNGKFHKHSTKG